MKIAIAGGIGSGKSAITAILRSLGAKVVVADEVNAQLLQDPEYISVIANTFSGVVHNNVIDKKQLADLIYNNETERRKLMDIAHPRIFKEMFSLYTDSDVVFYEIPLMTETSFSFDQIWFVEASIEDRVTRIAMRDHVTEEYAKRILLLQNGEEQIRSIATHIIKNDSNVESLVGKVKTLYYSILSEF